MVREIESCLITHGTNALLDYEISWLKQDCAPRVIKTQLEVEEKWVSRDLVFLSSVAFLHSYNNNAECFIENNIVEQLPAVSFDTNK